MPQDVQYSLMRRKLLIDDNLPVPSPADKKKRKKRRRECAMKDGMQRGGFPSGNAECTECTTSSVWDRSWVSNERESYLITNAWSTRSDGTWIKGEISIVERSCVKNFIALYFEISLYNSSIPFRTVFTICILRILNRRLETSCLKRWIIYCGGFSSESIHLHTSVS